MLHTLQLLCIRVLRFIQLRTKSPRRVARMHATVQLEATLPYLEHKKKILPEIKKKPPVPKKKSTAQILFEFDRPWVNYISSIERACRKFPWRIPAYIKKTASQLYYGQKRCANSAIHAIICHKVISGNPTFLTLLQTSGNVRMDSRVMPSLKKCTEIGGQQSTYVEQHEEEARRHTHTDMS